MILLFIKQNVMKYCGLKKENIDVSAGKIITY